ncbi:MAG: amidohydrolase family protein [bacterium]|nr:amidohydrolase family protein [Bacillota bacterium]HHW55933.1 amidohydrolase family protein [Bacillota bacterium]
MADLIIRKARAFGYEGLVDIAVKDGKIVGIAEQVQDKGRQEIAAEGRFVSPGLVDAHAHLDKALIFDRKTGNAEMDRRVTLKDMIMATRQLKREMTPEDVKERALELIKLSVAHGITTIRTYVEADPFIELRAAEGILMAKEEARDLVDLQTIAFAQEGWFTTPGTIESGDEKYLREALEMGIDLIGGNVNKTVWPSSPEAQIDRLFAIAREFDCDIDMHLDNADSAEAFSLPYVIDKTLENDYQGRVSAGHVVGIAHVEEKTRKQTIKGVKEAGITIAVLPSRMRLTCVREFMEGGVNISIGTDNYRDKFVYFGNPSLVERMLLLARIIDTQDDEELAEIYKMGTYNAARALRLADYGLDVGKRADLVVFDAYNLYDTVMQLPKCAYVIKNGRVVVEAGVLKEM